VELEKIAVCDEYFVKRNLYPNVRGLGWLEQGAIGGRG
jgi:hypothetical protein